MWYDRDVVRWNQYITMGVSENPIPSQDKSGPTGSRLVLGRRVHAAAPMDGTLPSLLPTHPQVAIIGAGPAGATAASLLAQEGFQVLVLERATFPRFTIGESLLPQAMELLEQAGLLTKVSEAGFQRKDGAIFQYRGQRETFCFAKGHTKGWGYTYQVQRDHFDQLLVEGAEAYGAHFAFGHSICAVRERADGLLLEVEGPDQVRQELAPAFVLDASGFGRVLPRYLSLDRPVSGAPREALFTHVTSDRRTKADEDNILIAIHPEHRDIWYWLIPFSDGSTSVGVVAPLGRLSDAPTDNTMRRFLLEEPRVSARVGESAFRWPARHMASFACGVTRLYGEHFALLGNAAEFLDPVFSSGVTLALKSAHLASQALSRQLRGEQVDWEKAFAQPLQRGVETFRTYVDAWYDGRFQEVLLSPYKPERIRAMLCSILSGYVWDQENPMVKRHRQRLDAIYKSSRNRRAQGLQEPT